MLRHVVMFKLIADDEATRAEHAAQIAAQLEGLVGVIPEVHSMQVGTNVAYPERNWDLCLVAEYDDVASLVAYNDHPEHERVAAFIRSLTSDRHTVDSIH